jgi:N-methylhydantoinase A
MRHDVVRSYSTRLADTSAEAVASAFATMEENLLSEILDEEHPRAKWQVERMIDVRYQGQSSEMTLPLAKSIDFSKFSTDLAEAFHVEHERNYGYRCEDEPVRIANLRVRAIARHTRLDVNAIAQNFTATKTKTTATQQTRNAYFGAVHGIMKATILQRSQISSKIRGPAIFDEFDTTVVVPPDWEAELDTLGNIVLTAIEKSENKDV